MRLPSHQTYQVPAYFTGAPGILRYNKRVDHNATAYDKQADLSEALKGARNVSPLQREEHELAKAGYLV